MKDHIAVILLLNILFVIGHNAQAQSGNSRWDVGITAGMNISTHTDKFLYKGGGYLTPESAAGYQAGFFIRRVIPSLKLQVEPSIIKLGARYSEEVSFQGTKLQTESWTKLLYFQLPMFAHFSPVKLERNSNSFYVIGGIFGDYLLDAHFKGTNSRAAEAFQHRPFFSNDVLTQYSRYDAGVLFGIGLEYEERIGFETRLQYTMIQSYQGNTKNKPKNLALTLSFYYLL